MNIAHPIAKRTLASEKEKAAGVRGTHRFNLIYAKNQASTLFLRSK